ncbi:amidohydrolase [Falsibacillus pallidus]|uniref:Amidohydrolase 3 domain-containing protein n=1 Tax=Falsibacillus pallidus TaxID=493781 RepID=A0A370GQP4_9BACI|nr:amidohydrolase [Falsibacillus pallidus]RDI44283.1 hypothetical protein DFR59_103354 [Falsibacillus pallidus]
MGKLIFNGTIYTMAAEGETVEAVYVENGKIADSGNLDSIKIKYSGRITDMIDLVGSTMYPGFTDSHMHLIGHGETLIRLDLSEMSSKEEVYDTLQKRSAMLAPGEWIIGEGWNENLWEPKETPNRFELDEYIPDHPVLIKRICRHAVCVNSKALKLAAIDEMTNNPDGGIIERDEHGRINGVLKDQAQDLIFTVIPEVTEAYLEHAVRAAIDSCWKYGLIGGHTEDLNYYGGYQRTIDAFRKVIVDEGKRFKAHLLIHHEAIPDWANEDRSTVPQTEYIEFGSMKIFADGALGGRTALLSHPYADEPSTNGVAIHSREELRSLLAKAREHSLPVAVHTIGDLAFESVLDAIIENPPPKGKRDRLIHAQILRQELIEKAKGQPIVLDIQPRFVASDFPWVIDRIGKDRMKYNYAWKTLLDNGIPCAGGSDAPIEPVNPLLGIYEAVSRVYLHQNMHHVYNPEEKLSVYEAISLFTKGSAYAASHEMDRGMIRPGYDADFTVLDKDLFSISEEDIPQAKTVMTIIDGEIVYNHKE